MSLAKKWKSAIALFLAVVMAISFVPNITARADEPTLYTAVKEGLNLTYGVGCENEVIGSMTKTDWLKERDAQPKFLVFMVKNADAYASEADVYVKTGTAPRDFYAGLAAEEGSISANVTSQSSTDIYATLPAGMPAGIYRVVPYFGTMAADDIDTDPEVEALPGFYVGIKKATKPTIQVTQLKEEVVMGTDSFGEGNATPIAIVDKDTLKVVDADGLEVPYAKLGNYTYAEDVLTGYENQYTLTGSYKAVGADATAFTTTQHGVTFSENVTPC